MKLRSRRMEVWAFPLALLIASILVVVSDAGGVGSRLRGILFDSYQHSAALAGQAIHLRAPPAAGLLNIDHASLQRFGPWPWPRSLLARLIAKLKTAGVSAIVIAMPLDQPDPASPERLIAALPDTPQSNDARTALSKLPAPDESLATALLLGKSVTGFVLGESGRPPALAGKIEFSGDPAVLARVPGYATASGALAQFDHVPSGALNLLPDADGSVRRLQLVFRLKGKLVPSLAVEAARLAKNAQDIIVRVREAGRNLAESGSAIAAVDLGSLEVPAGPDGSMWISYSGERANRNISAAALDRGALSPGSLKNAVVFVGAPDDVVRTPYGIRTVAWVEAVAFENMLSGAHLERPASALTAESVFLGVVGLAIVLLFARGQFWMAGILTGAGIAGFAYLSWWLFTQKYVLLDALSPDLALALVFCAGASVRGLEVGRARARLKSAFAEALSADAVERIARTPALLKLEGEARTVSYLACGIRGFAGLADSFRDDPKGFTDLMARALTPLIDVALSKGATLDRMTTDGFSSFWNAPLDDPEHAIHACEAASRMTEVVAEVNDALSRERRFDGLAYQPIEIGIGISTGMAIAGGFGAHGRNAYSATGDCTQVANRIQALSAQYGPAIIVSEDTRKEAERGFAFLEVDYIAAGPRDEPVKLYAVLGNPLVRASPKFRALATFHEHIFQSLRTQQWEKTKGLIEQCRKLSGASQKLYDLHLARIAYFEDNPPGPDWDGAFRPILK